MTKVIIRVGKSRASNEGGQWSSDEPTLARYLNSVAGPRSLPEFDYIPDAAQAMLGLAKAALPSLEVVLLRVIALEPGRVY
jgi:hypothetical protein